eukprot:6538490-Prymnesium_polylepis.1
MTLCRGAGSISLTYCQKHILVVKEELRQEQVRRRVGAQIAIVVCAPQACAAVTAACDVMAGRHGSVGRHVAVGGG